MPAKAGTPTGQFPPDSRDEIVSLTRTITNTRKDVEVDFPVIEDPKMDVAKAFGMLQPGASNTQAVRAVFMIDPKSIVRAILHYPLSNGRNMDEVMRLLIAMQTSDEYGVATPANWQPGDDVIVPPPGSCGTAKDRVQKPDPDVKCLDWFMCLKKSPIR